MKSLYCRNIGLYGKNQDGEYVREKRACGRFLGQVTDRQIELLKLDPEEYMVLRCPSCKGDTGRWIKIYHNGKGLVQEASFEPPKRSPEPWYDDIINVQSS